MPDEAPWLRRWIIFGVHADGAVDVNDGDADVLRHVPRAFAEEAIRYRAETVEVLAADPPTDPTPAGGPCRRREFDDGYAVVRVDGYQGAGCPEEDKVTVKEVARDEAAARDEVGRLNGLGKNGVRYFWQATRVERPAGGDDTAAADHPEGT
jgi:hypothetical protein